MLTQLRSVMKSLLAPVSGVEASTLSTQPPANAPSPTSAQRARAAAMLIVAIVISIGVLILTTAFREPLLALGQFGLIGVFVLSVLGNATVIIPAPVFVVACAAGPLYGPVATGLVAGAGAAIGEMTGYLAGYGGTAVLPQGPLYQRLHELMRRYGPLVIFALSVLPNPFFDVGGLIAGVLKMNPFVFLIATFLGKSIRLGVTAYACANGIPFLAQFFSPRAAP